VVWSTNVKDPLFNIGQRVKTIPVSGYDPEMDRIIGGLAGQQGTIVKYYCIGREEMPDRIKMFAYPETVYSYDIRLDNGDVLRGMPEVALEPGNRT
jgi:hypothetical protein